LKDKRDICFSHTSFVFSFILPEDFFLTNHPPRDWIINSIKEPIFAPLRYIGIIESIKELISRDWIVSFAFTHRKAIQCADFVANVGTSVMDCLRIFLEPPKSKPFKAIPIEI
jgi:hypothetical protein